MWNAVKGSGSLLAVPPRTRARWWPRATANDDL